MQYHTTGNPLANFACEQRQQERNERSHTGLRPLYVTPNYLNVLCQDLPGKTAGEVIRDQVLLEAKLLPTNAAMTVTGIACDLNFQTTPTSTASLKKETGVMPDEFRKQFIQQ